MEKVVCKHEVTHWVNWREKRCSSCGALVVHNPKDSTTGLCYFRMSHLNPEIDRMNREHGR